MRAFEVPRALAAILLFAGLAGPCGAASTRGAHLAKPAPSGRVMFKSYGLEQGLANLAAVRLAQDTHGFLWIGTQGNLFRYDGLSFRSYGFKEGLPSGHVNALLATPDGSLWVGTWQGLAYGSNGSFRTIPAEKGLPVSKIYDLILDTEGKLGVGTPSGPFVSKGDGTFEKISGWPGGEASALCASDHPKGVWIASGPRLFFHAASGSWKEFGPESGLAADRIDRLARDTRGRLFVRSAASLWMLPPGSSRFQDLSRNLPGRSQADGSLYIDSEGRLWVPTDGGIAILDGDRWENLGVNEGLPSPSPRAVLVDREDSLWIAGQGIHRSLGYRSWRAYTTREGLPHDLIWTILRDSSGGLWVGTNGGLSHCTAQGWATLQGTEHHCVRTLAQAKDGALWIAGTMGELLRWNPSSGRLDQFGPSAKLKGAQVLHLSFDHEGTLWAGTDSAGLIRGESKGSGWAFERVPLPDGLPRERVNQILEDPQGRLWVAGEAGLAVRQHGVWRRFKKKDGLRQDHLTSLLLTRSGELRASYFEPLGIARIKIMPNGIQVLGHLDRGTGLSSDTVYLTGEDAKSRFWIGTDHGLVVQENGLWSHLGKADGLVGEDCDAKAFLADPNGDVWVGTSTGLVRFMGKMVSPTRGTHPCTILTARIGGHPVPLDEARELQLNRSDDSLEVSFSNLSFVDESRSEYQFKLLGRDKDWRTTRSGEAYFSMLPPNHYVFQVRSRSLEGDWGPISAFRFRIQPAWWQNLWIHLLLVLAVTAGVGRFLQLHIRTLKKRTMELEVLLKLADSLTRELESANLNLQEQSLTDPLTGLRNRRYLTATIERDLAQVERQHRMKQQQSHDGEFQNIDLLFFMVDIDHFKWVNDTYGHAAGDSVLQQFAEILRSATRGSDTVIRWGGEEFLILARQSRREDAMVLAERVRRSVEGRRFELPGDVVIQRTCSIGFAPYPVEQFSQGKITWEQVIDLADQCLYRAKTSGRNQWIGVIPDNPPAAEENKPPAEPSLDEFLKSGLLRLVTSEVISDAKMFLGIAKEKR